MTSFLLVGSYQETANGHSWRRVHPFVGWRYSDTARSGPIVTCLSIFQCKGRFAMRYEPLSRFPALRTRDVDELRQRMSGLFSVRSMDLGRGARRTFEGRLNHRQLRDVGRPLSYAASRGGRRPSGVYLSTAVGSSRESRARSSSCDNPVCCTSAARTSCPIACLT